ncbi:MAG: carbon-nitrogen hydrolase family protein [Anaerolineales bacterium]|nr:carbon-nitrogen hydrolase family protein [Anaerolineales bacterium]
MAKTNLTSKSNQLKVGLVQMAPIWLNRDKTLRKIEDFLHQACKENCNLVVFGEAIVPGYPFWVERTDGARFNNRVQKEIHAYYQDQAVQIEAGHLDSLCKAARKQKIAVYLGTVERPVDRGGHSLYCSLVYINPLGEIGSVHRKLMPTYEERLVWSTGDGHGLQVHPLGPFTIGGLNCWENWMPLSRTALYGMGEDLHVAVWPGSQHNTFDITKFIAKESRSYVISVSGLMRRSDITSDLPHSQLMQDNFEEIQADGGSCLAGPDGKWIVEPIIGEETLITTEISHQLIREERQNFDPAGHYGRPDVTRLVVNRSRQSLLEITTDIEGFPDED